MKKLVFFLIVTTIAYSQSDTEIYLYQLTNSNGEYEITSGKNISNNPGYDSQPHFYSKKLYLHLLEINKQTLLNTIWKLVKLNI